jgi:plasmid maintenance system antidote protein VapI
MSSTIAKTNYKGGVRVNIKEKIREQKVNQWEIAEKLGVNEFTLSRYLRRPERLSAEVVAKIEKAIVEIKRGE